MNAAIGVVASSLVPATWAAPVAVGACIGAVAIVPESDAS